VLVRASGLSRRRADPAGECLTGQTGGPLLTRLPCWLTRGLIGPQPVGGEG
jgi:hypothetical protein